VPYTLEHGSYYLRDRPDGPIRLMTDQVTLAFSHDCYAPDEVECTGWVIHKHGRLEDVRAWWRANRKVAAPLFGEVHLVTFPSRFDVDRINATIEHPIRLAKLIEEAFWEMELEPAEPPSRYDVLMGDD